MEDSIFCKLGKFAEAFPRNRNKYMNYALRFVHDRDVVEDLVNDSFAMIWERRNEISNTNIEAYFYITIKTTCLCWLRKKAIRCKVHQHIQETSYSLLQYDIASLDAFDPNPIFSSEIRDIMLQRLKKMPELSQNIFMDNRFSDLSYDEIAAKYGISRFKVTRVIQAALTCLRISLRDYLPLVLIASFLGLTFL